MLCTLQSKLLFKRIDFSETQLMLLTELNFQIKTKTTLKNELFIGLVSKKKKQ